MKTSHRSDVNYAVNRRFVTILSTALCATMILSFAMFSRADDDEADEAPAEVVRTRAEVEALIRAAGQTPPDWWEDVPLNYPPALDLTWDDAQRGPTRNALPRPK